MCKSRTSTGAMFAVLSVYLVSMVRYVGIFSLVGWEVSVEGRQSGHTA